MGKLGRYKFVYWAIFFLFGKISWAVPIGIVDSGTDVKHIDFSGKIWSNPGGLKGDEFKDDINGWNFSENNNQVIDYSYLGKFSSDVKKFFDIQIKLMTAKATESDKKWIIDKQEDHPFLEEVETFGNFIHGTHVAGIASNNADDARIMAAKIIPTEVKDPAPSILVSLMPYLSLSNSTRDVNSGDHLILEGFLSEVVDQQVKLLITVGQYLASTEMKVANCSFGTSMDQAQSIIAQAGKIVFGHELTDSEIDKYSKFFMLKLIEKGADFVKVAPHSLFVLAAGNEGTNNDQSPVFPANLKLENTISVAATRGYESLASFSNYGEKNVEIAAPGVGIVSSIPGGDHLALSGTSQAAPFITKIAGKIMDSNPKLNFIEIKQILMGTVDKKKFLEGKVQSGGIANEERAIRAAVLSTELTLDEAIRQACQEVMDVRIAKFRAEVRRDGRAIPLPSLFDIRIKP